VRVAAVADVHVGNRQRFARGTMKAGVNLRARLIVRVLADAYMVACQQDCDAFVIPGDLFDVVRPEPQLIAAVQQAFEDGAGRGSGRPRVFILVGNHEQASGEPGDHALGPLAPVADVYERPLVKAVYGDDGEASLAMYMLPYSPSVPGNDYVEQALAHIELNVSVPSDESILFAHLGVEDSGTPVWLRGAHDSVKATVLADAMRKMGISCAIVGNWHDHRVWRFDDGIEIVQCGALVPTGFDNPSTPTNLGPDSDPYGSVIVWDSSRPRGHRCERIVMNGPRFVQSRSVSDVCNAIETGCADHGHKVFARVIASADAVPSITQSMNDLVSVQAGKDFWWEVVADHDDVKKRVASAAMSARDAQTTDRALAEYVFEMPLDDDLDRQRVLDLARQCIAGAEG